MGLTLAHLCLGTASWGAPYRGRIPPSDDELRRILDVAEGRGIRWIDTAVAYGNAEHRLLELGAWDRFRIVTKIQAGDRRRPVWYAQIVLSHVRMEDAAVWMPGPDGGALLGASVYTPEQALTALPLAALQVPWNRPLMDGEPRWMEVRDMAYGAGVLFFGRQPFGFQTVWTNSAQDRAVRRHWFEWALQTNPRGWCVVGVETTDQLRELCEWRDGLAKQ